MSETTVIFVYREVSTGILDSGAHIVVKQAELMLYMYKVKENHRTESWSMKTSYLVHTVKHI